MGRLGIFVALWLALAGPLLAHPKAQPAPAFTTAPHEGMTFGASLQAPAPQRAGTPLLVIGRIPPRVRSQRLVTPVAPFAAAAARIGKHRISAFPTFMHGVWSNKGTCKGDDLDAEITISALGLAFYEGRAKVQVLQQEGDRYDAQVLMRGEGTTYNARYFLYISRDRSYMVVWNIAEPIEQKMTYYRNSLTCRQLKGR